MGRKKKEPEDRNQIKIIPLSVNEENDIRKTCEEMSLGIYENKLLTRALKKACEQLAYSYMASNPMPTGLNHYESIVVEELKRDIFKDLLNESKKEIK